MFPAVSIFLKFIQFIEIDLKSAVAYTAPWPKQPWSPRECVGLSATLRAILPAGLIVRALPRDAI
jgi:hypothetical protein